MTQKKTINLIPGEPSKKKTALKAVAAKAQPKGPSNLFTFFILLALGAAAYGGWVVYRIKSLENELTVSKNKLQKSKTNLNLTQTQSAQLEKQKSDLAKDLEQRKLNLQALASTMPGDKDYAALLSSIVGLMPKDMWLVQLVLNDDQLQVTGAATSPELIVELTNQMDKSGRFKDSVFTSSERQTVETHIVYNFKVTSQPVWEAFAAKK